MWEKMGIENAIKMFFEHLKGREWEPYRMLCLGSVFIAFQLWFLTKGLTILIEVSVVISVTAGAYWECTLKCAIYIYNY
jgi:hypothetical protein